MQLNLLNRFSGGDFNTNAANSNDIRQGIIGLMTLIVILLTIVFFIMWFRRAYYNLHQSGVRGLSFDEGWAAGCWFVPFLNLVRPYQIMREIWVETQRIIPGNTYIKGAGLVGWWWALYLISNFFSTFSARMTTDATTIEELTTASTMNALSAFIEIPSIVATIFMIQETSAFEEQLYKANPTEPDILEHLVES